MGQYGGRARVLGRVTGGRRAGAVALGLQMAADLWVYWLVRGRYRMAVVI